MYILGLKKRKELTDFANNGVEAVEAINSAFERDNSGKYSLIFMDCSMPFMDGITATK